MTDLALFTSEDLAEELLSRADHGLIVLLTERTEDTHAVLRQLTNLAILVTANDLRIDPDDFLAEHGLQFVGLPVPVEVEFAFQPIWPSVTLVLFPGLDYSNPLEISKRRRFRLLRKINKVGSLKLTSLKTLGSYLRVNVHPQLSYGRLKMRLHLLLGLTKQRYTIVEIRHGGWYLH